MRRVRIDGDTLALSDTMVEFLRKAAVEPQSTSPQTGNTAKGLENRGLLRTEFVDGSSWRWRYVTSELGDRVVAALAEQDAERRAAWQAEQAAKAASQ